MAGRQGGQPGRRILNKGLRAKVQEYFSKRPGQTVYLADLMTDVGATSEHAMKETISSLRSAIPAWAEALQIDIHGRAWKYMPPGKQAGLTTKRLFEELAVTKSGDILIQDQDGRVYRAVEL